MGLPMMLSANDFSGNNPGSYDAEIYCIPTFTVSGVGGTSGTNSYTQFLGNYFLGYVGNVTNKSIVFTLTGPGELAGGTPIDYSVWTTNDHTTDDYATLTIHWKLVSGDFPSGTDLGGNPQLDGSGNYVHLIQENNNCDSYATLTVTSITIDLSSPSCATGTHTFSVSLTASATI
jgi:hypothetical protein